MKDRCVLTHSVKRTSPAHRGSQRTIQAKDVRGQPPPRYVRCPDRDMHNRFCTHGRRQTPHGGCGRLVMRNRRLHDGYARAEIQRGETLLGGHRSGRSRIVRFRDRTLHTTVNSHIGSAL